MRSKILSFLAISSMLFALVSCGPMYQTRRNYFPPRSSEGMRCVGQCISNKSHCSSQCNSQKQLCAAINGVQNAYQSSRADAACARDKTKCGPRYSPYYSGGSYECASSFESCNAECLNMYDSCYMSCGGRVEYYQVCVAFCDKK